MTTSPFKTKIELTNSGKLSIFFIGTGSAFTKKSYQTNLVVVKGKDHILIDCGTLCPYVLENTYNTPLSNLQNVLITHPHADHIGGVEEMALVGMYIAHHKYNMVVPQKLKRKLWNESLRGGLQFSENGKLSFDDYFTHLKPKKILSKPFDMFEYNMGSINIKLFRTRHVATKPNSFKQSQISYGMIFDDKILFTADTQFNPAQLKYLLDKYNIDTIFHDCDIIGYSKGVHATYEQLITLPEDVKNKIYLCHCNDMDEDKKPDPKKDGFLGYAQAGVYYNF